MNSPIDEKLKRVYEVFYHDHDRLRGNLLGSLPAQPCEPPLSRNVFKLWYFLGGTKMKRQIVAAAIAAAIMLLALNFWPVNSKDGIAWADVVRQIHEVKSLVWVWNEEEIDSAYSAPKVKGRWKCYYKDPGMSREDHFIVGTTQPSVLPDATERCNRINIRGMTPTKSNSYDLAVLEKKAWIQITTFSPPITRLPTEAMAIWSKLGRITSDKTCKIGHKEINGIACVGFEAHINAFEPRIPMKGKVRVWSEKDTGIPVLVELQYQAKGGTYISGTTIDHIQWNAVLSDDLFKLPDLKGWKVEEVRSSSEQVFFSCTRLRNDIPFQVRRKDGTLILNVADVFSMKKGGIYTTLTNGKLKKQVEVFAVLNQEGRDKIKKIWAKGQNLELLADFNGKSQSAGYVPISNNGPGIMIDITSMNITPKEFEDNYLTSGN
ncbi:MAG: hypothetical protein WC975_05710 [Phycisphaerae bacterium]